MAGEVIPYNPNAAQPARQAHMLPQSLSDASRIAEMIAASGLFGCKTKEQAFSLMLLADAEGLHPAAAARDYHIIEGRPSLKADAMLARYMAAGGKVEWLARTDEKVAAKFTHPSSGTVEVEWTMDRAKNIKRKGKSLTEGDNWRNYPRQMLAARTISEGVRASFPGVVSGVYTPEELMDMEPSAATPRAAASPPATPAVEVEEPAARAGDSNPTAPVASSIDDVEYVEQMPPSKPATQTLGKSKARADFAAMVDEIRQCQSMAELKDWGRRNAERVGLQPDDWKPEIRKEYEDMVEGFRRIAEAQEAADRAFDEERR